MSDDNTRNLHYFEAPSMRKLFTKLEEWQAENQQRLLSVSVLNDQGVFCCIALTTPSEVIIVDGSQAGGARVTQSHLATTG